jgi:rubrerythrin
VDYNQLRRLVADVDEEHREAMRSFTDDLGAQVFDADDATRSARRDFLRGVGFGAAALTVGGATLLVPAMTAAAQEPQPMPISAVTTSPRRPTPEDIQVLLFAQSVELAAAEGYRLAADTGLISEEVTPVALGFRQHHLEHARGVGAQAGSGARGRPNRAVVAEFGPRLQAATNERELLEVAFELEMAAASTYAFALGAVQATRSAELMAAIMPIEARHAVVLGEVLGLDPSEYIPTFEDPDAGLTPDAYPIEEM